MILLIIKKNMNSSIEKKNKFIKDKMYEWLLNQKCIGKIPEHIIHKKKEEFLIEFLEKECNELLKENETLEKEYYKK